MWKRLKKIKPLFRRESRAFNFEPVTHPLNTHPVLPRGMMSAIAPAYEAALAREKREEGKKAPQKPQE